MLRFPLRSSATARFLLLAGPILVLGGILGFGGRTELTLSLLTGALWLGIGLALSLVLGAKILKARGSPPKRRSADSEGPRTSRSEQSARRGKVSTLAVVTCLCWGGLILLQWMGFQNPAYYPAGPDLYDGVYPLEAKPLWPTTANAERGFDYLCLLAGILGWTVLTACYVRGRQKIARAALFVFLGFSLLAALGTLARLTGTDKILWLFESHTSYFYGTFFYKNHWAELAVLMTAVGIGLARRFWRTEKHAGHFPDRTVSFTSLVFLVALTIPLANARGATLALIGVLLALTGAMFRRQAQGGKNALRSALLFILGLLVLGGSFFYLAAPALTEAADRTEAQWSQYKEGNLDYPELRGYLWQDALGAFAARPLTGWGIGSYAHIQVIFAGEKLRSIGDGQSPPLVEFAHNDYLQCLVEFGLLGTLLLLLPPIVALIKAYRGGAVGLLSSWIGIGLLAVLFTAAIDFPFGNPAIALCFGWFAALSYAAARSSA